MTNPGLPALADATPAHLTPRRVLVTGGTGSLGSALLRAWLAIPETERAVCFSRDEVKQAELALRLPDPRVRWFLGDVRDEARVRQACWHVDAVIHCAALKRVDAVAYNPTEVLRTNVDGTRAVIEAAAAAGVPRVLVISSDKACEPWNIYGVSKAAAEHLAVAANAYTLPAQGTAVSVVRYGNVLGSRGSVIHAWRTAMRAGQPIRLTDPRMTRFFLTLPDAVALVQRVLEAMQGGEIFVPVLPAIALPDLARAVIQTEGEPGWPVVETGWRPGGEKLHERLLTREELTRTLARQDHVLYVVTPHIRTWSEVPYAGAAIQTDWEYTSEAVPWRLSAAEMVESLRRMDGEQ